MLKDNLRYKYNKMNLCPSCDILKNEADKQSYIQLYNSLISNN